MHTSLFSTVSLCWKCPGAQRLLARLVGALQFFVEGACDREHLEPFVRVEDLPRGPERRRRIGVPTAATFSLLNRVSVRLDRSICSCCRRRLGATSARQTWWPPSPPPPSPLYDGIHVCLQGDGGRMGKPAELTYLFFFCCFFFLWLMEADLACVLTPQAFQ